MHSGTNSARPARRRGLSGRFDGATGFLFILGALLVPGYGLAFTQQGLDIVKSVAGDVHDPFATVPLCWLCASITFLGFQAWFWARFCVEEQMGTRDHWRNNPLLVWTPRLFAAVPFGFLTYAYLKAEADMPPEASHTTMIAWVILLLGAALLAFVICREDITRRLRHRHSAIDAALSVGRPVVLRASLALAAIMLIVFCVAPVAPAQFFGPCAVVLLSMALIIPGMTWLIHRGLRVGVRATECALVLALVSNSFGLADNHAVRLTAKVDKDPRQTVDQLYGSWLAQAGKAADGSRPIVFVASAGGASRAGFLTGEVLSRLEELSGGQFSRHTFAISSISGGSLGSVGFLASRGDGGGLDQLAERTADFTGRDYLSPAVAGMFFPDLLQRFWPLVFLPDRAQALEQGWEDGWTRHCRAGGMNTATRPSCNDPRLLGRDFLSHWRGSAAWSPIAIIGGGHEESGKPIVTSTARLDGFVDAGDFHHLTGRDVRLSTAILNGARFPYISPGGAYRPTVGKAGHIVDGGYFDAAGVETVRELAANVFSKVAGADTARLAPIYLLIDNSDAPDDPTDTSVKPANLDPDAFGPLRGLYAARSAHGDLLVRFLRDHPPAPADYDPAPTTSLPADTPCNHRAHALPGNVVAICLCRPGAPMDWVLSRWSQHFMRDQLGQADLYGCGNYLRLVALAQRLRGANNL